MSPDDMSFGEVQRHDTTPTFPTKYLIGNPDVMVHLSPFIPLVLVPSTSNQSKSINRSGHPEPFIHHKVSVANMSDSDYEDGCMSVIGEDNVVDGDALIASHVPHHHPQTSAAEASQGSRHGCGAAEHRAGACGHGQEGHRQGYGRIASEGGSPGRLFQLFSE